MTRSNATNAPASGEPAPEQRSRPITRANRLVLTPANEGSTAEPRPHVRRPFLLADAPAWTALPTDHCPPTPPFTFPASDPLPSKSSHRPRRLAV